MLQNITRGIVLAERPYVAVTWWKRARGMIGMNFQDFDAMILPSCRAIHTWFMSQPLDLIFVDDGRRAVSFETGVRPWRMMIGPQTACTVIELPPGRLSGIPMHCNDVLTW